MHRERGAQEEPHRGRRENESPTTRSADESRQPMPWQRWTSRRNRYINDLQCKRPWLGECVTVCMWWRRRARGPRASSWYSTPAPHLARFSVCMRAQVSRHSLSLCGRILGGLPGLLQPACAAQEHRSKSGGFVRVRSAAAASQQREKEEEEEEEEKEEEEHEKGGRRKIRRGQATHFSSIKASCSLRNGRRNCE